MITCICGHGSSLRLTTLLGLIMVYSGAQAGEMFLRAEPLEGAPGAAVEVPIVVSGAAGMEGLQFVLTFDPALLEHTAVKLAPLAAAAAIPTVVWWGGGLILAVLAVGAIRRKMRG